MSRGVRHGRPRIIATALSYSANHGRACGREAKLKLQSAPAHATARSRLRLGQQGARYAPDTATSSTKSGTPSYRQRGLRISGETSAFRTLEPTHPGSLDQLRLEGDLRATLRQHREKRRSAALTALLGRFPTRFEFVQALPAGLLRCQAMT